MTEHDWHRPAYIGMPGPLQKQGEHDWAEKVMK